jgi:transposase-like protein
VKGVSTRKVDDLVRALGIDGISRSEVSRICKVLDEEVGAFLGRAIEEPCPYLWLDATFHKVREAGRVISVATVVAIGVTEHGERTVLGAATGASAAMITGFCALQAHNAMSCSGSSLDIPALLHV